MGRLPTCCVLFWMLAVPALAPAQELLSAPLARRVGLAKLVVYGTVVKIEKQACRETVEGDPCEYHVLLVKIEENLLGADGLTHVRVGFNVLSIASKVQWPEWKIDDQVCLLLAPHERESFFVPTIQSLQGASFKSVDDKFFAQQLEQLRHYTKLLRDPKAGLQAKAVDDRFLTAAMLLERYRPFGSYARKSTPIGLEESTLILLALRDVPWARDRPDGMYPDQYFSRLGLRLKDGWRRPIELKDYEPEAKHWLKANAGSYRVQRLLDQ